jgi:hypothetical protein
LGIWVITQTVAIDQGRGAKRLYLLARCAVGVAVQGKWVSRISVEGRLSIDPTEEVLAVGPRCFLC